MTDVRGGNIVAITNKTAEEAAIIACQRDEQDLQGHTGRHCQMEDCKQFDVLPFHCGCCHKFFCREHYSQASHGCEIVDRSSLPHCPLCNQTIHFKAAEETKDAAVDAHIMSGCKSHLADQVRAQREAMSACMHGKGKKACKDKSLIKFDCKGCGKQFCMKHFRNHKCKPVNSTRPQMLGAAPGLSVSVSA